MTYRDDTALEEACDVLEGTVADLQLSLNRLVRRGEELDRDVSRARKRLVVLRFKQWIRRNPKSFVVLLLIVLFAVYASVKKTLFAQEQRSQRVATLGGDCKTRLLVQASHPRATALINEVKMGTVPLDVQICPGTYRLRLVHHQTLPWQVQFKVGKQEKIEYQTKLALRGTRVIPRTGTLVLSQPPGALLFVNGREVGWTPVVVGVPSNSKARLRIGLWRPGFRPGLWHLEPRPSLWLHLGALPPEAAP